MKTFVILSPPSSSSLDAFKSAVRRVFPDRFFEIAEDLSPVQVGERLGPEGQIGQFVVFATDGHYGWHRKDLWDWLKAKAFQ